MRQLADFIRSTINISDQDLRNILSHFEEKVIVKDSFILKKKQIATEYYFVQSGALRIFFDNQDKEVTAWIALENDFFTDLSSLKNQVESRFYIQAIEDTILLTIKREEMEKLYQKFPEWQQFGRQIWENIFMKISESMISFQTMTAEERYLEMMKNSKLLNRVSLKDLASFLGVTATSLSRIRKNIK